MSIRERVLSTVVALLALGALFVTAGTLPGAPAPMSVSVAQADHWGDPGDYVPLYPGAEPWIVFEGPDVEDDD